MPTVKPGSKSLTEVMNDHHYPSNVDNMVSNDKPFEGSENMLPGSETNPIPGADGKLPLRKAKQ